MVHEKQRYDHIFVLLPTGRDYGVYGGNPNFHGQASLSDKDRVVKVEDLGNADPESKYEFIAMIPAGEKTGVLQVTVQKNW